MKHVCPRCDVPLLVLQFQRVDVDFCNHCHGLWLDAGELEELLTRTGAHANDPFLGFQRQTGRLPAGRQHLCPRCDEPLWEIQVQHPGAPPLTLDKCPRGHGLWFDANELERLLAMFPPRCEAAKTINYLHELFSTQLHTTKEVKQ